MSINFSEINLTIMDLSINSSPDIFINTSGVTFSKCVLELLGYPANIQFCVDIEHKVFALKPCRACDTKAFPFVKENRKTGKTLCIANKNLKDSLMAMMPECDPTLRYKLIGDYDKEHRIMYFSLKEATVCEFQPQKKQ